MNKIHLLGIIGIVLVVALLIVVPLQGTGLFGAKDYSVSKLKLGAILPFSGVNSAWGINGQRGIELALSEYANVKELPLEVIYEDSKGEDVFAVSSAQKLISIDEVNVLYTSFTGPSIAVAPIANDNNVLQLYEASVKKPIELFPNNSIKIGYYSLGVTCAKVALAAKEMGHKRFALVFAQKDFSIECKSAFKSILGEEAILDEYSFLVSKEDFRSILAKISSQSYDAIALTGYQADFSTFYKSYLEADLNVQILCLAGEDCVSDVISKVPQNTIFYQAKINPVFEKKFFEKYGYISKRDLSSAATTYDMTRLLLSAIKMCPTKSRDCLKDAILNSKMQTTIETYGFIGNSLELNPELFIVDADGNVHPLN